MFADDIGLLARHRSVAVACRRLSRALVHLLRWATRWLVDFNLGKCFSTLITRCQRVLDPVVYFAGRALPFRRRHTVEDSISYLGVVLDRGLTWRDNLVRTHSRASRRLELLLRITSDNAGARHSRVLLLYRVCVRPFRAYVLYLGRC